MVTNNWYTYDNAREWADLDRVYIAVIERFSRPDRKTLIDMDIEVYRMPEEANDAARWHFTSHLTKHELAKVRTYAGLVRREDLCDDLRDWRVDEQGEDIPDWLAIGSIDTFPGAYDSKAGDEK